MDGSLAAPVLLTWDTQAGLTVDFSPSSLSSGSSNLTLNVAGTAAPGIRTVLLRGSGNGETVLLPLTLYILPQAASSGLTLQVPLAMSVRQGGSTASQVQLQRDPGVVGNVSLSLDNPPAGITGSFSVNPLGQAQSLLMLQVANSVAVGFHPVTLRAAQGSHLASVSILLQVVEAAEPVNFWLNRMELAQSFFAKDPGLVAGKSALLRAHVLADQSIPSPVVQLTASVGATVLGSLQLQGPASLSPAEVPDSLGMSFTATLPGSWVQPGLRLQLDVDPLQVMADRLRADNSLTVNPTVGAGNEISLVLVPLVLAGRTGSPLDYTSAMLDHWPLKNLQVSVRAAHTVSSVASVQASGDGWSSVLNELASLRSSDGSNAYYFGVLDAGYNSGVAGMGFVGAPVAIGWDRSVGVMLHELGHNFGLSHAPCGNPSGPDSNYPYTGATCGTWGYRQSTGELQSPNGLRDLMSYCGPDWISDYNFKKVQNRLSGSLLLAQAVVASAEEPLLKISGCRRADGSLRLDPVLRQLGVSPQAASGELMLYMDCVSGPRYHPFQVAAIGCNDDSGDQFFHLTVPDPGDLRALEIRQGSKVLLREKVRVDGPAHALQWSERQGQLILQWDQDAYASLTVVHDGAQRRTLGLRLSGGQASLPIADLPVGGSYEFCFAQGVDGLCIRMAR